MLGRVDQIRQKRKVAMPDGGHRLSSAQIIVIEIREIDSTID
jgi:hypothetical protein